MRLHEYQEYAKTWIVEHPYCGLLLDMGLGKTLTTLAAIDEIQNIFSEDHKILIVAPKKGRKKHGQRRLRNGILISPTLKFWGVRENELKP